MNRANASPGHGVVAAARESRPIRALPTAIVNPVTLSRARPSRRTLGARTTDKETARVWTTNGGDSSSRGPSVNLHHGSFAVQASWTTNVRHSPTFQSDAQPALNKAPSAVLDRSARAFAYSGRESSRAKPLHPGVDQTSGRNPAAHRIGQVAQARHEKGRTTTGVDKVLAEHGRWETCDYPGARRADAIRQGIRSRQRDRLMEQTTGDTLTGNHEQALPQRDRFGVSSLVT